MKNRDIINIIKKESEKIEIPNLSKSILENHQNKELFRKENKVSDKEPKIRIRFGIKPIKALAFVLMLFLIIPATIITVDLINNDENEIDNTPVKLNVSKTKEVVGIQAASLFGFAEQNEESTIKTLSLTDDDYEEMSNELNQYLFSIEELMNKSNNKYELYELKEGDYKYKMIVSIDSNGLLSNYIMYFNENSAETDYENIDEVSSEISGYVESGEKKYFIFGTKEVENDECEVELKLYLDEEKNSYIIASQEIEKKESEYSFKYFKNGNVEKEIEISTEVENDEYFVSVEVKKGNKHNGYKIKYDEKTKMKVEFDYEDNFGEFYIDVYEEEYEYLFNEDKKVNHGRPEHSHGGGQWNDEHHPNDNNKPNDDFDNDQDNSNENEGSFDDDFGDLNGDKEHGDRYPNGDDKPIIDDDDLNEGKPDFGKNEDFEK